MALRLDDLPWGNGSLGAWAYLEYTARQDPSFFLDVIDQCLTMVSGGASINRLQEILNGGGSVFLVGPDGEGQLELQRRIDSTAKEAVQAAAPPGSAAAQHLSTAWSDIYGRNPDPSSGYREAVRAVEAVAAPIVSPNNPSPTLGSMLADLKNRHWSTATSLVPIQREASPGLHRLRR
jgi:hypothetical protein